MGNGYKNEHWLVEGEIHDGLYLKWSLYHWATLHLLLLPTIVKVRWTFQTDVNQISSLVLGHEVYPTRYWAAMKYYAGSWKDSQMQC